MSSQLSVEETALESELDRSQDVEVSVKFRISKEAMARLVPPRTSRRQFEEAFTMLLACGLYTRIQDVRDKKIEGLLEHVRQSQVALTNLETAVLWAEKAVVSAR